MRCVLEEEASNLVQLAWAAINDERSTAQTPPGEPGWSEFDGAVRAAGGGGGRATKAAPGLGAVPKFQTPRARGWSRSCRHKKARGNVQQALQNVQCKRLQVARTFLGYFAHIFFLKKHPKWGGNDNTKTKRDANLCSRKLLNNDTMISFCKISSKMVKTQLRDNGGSGGKSISLCKVQHPEKSSKVLVRQNIPCPRETVS